MKISFKCQLELNFEQKKDQVLEGDVAKQLPLYLDLAPLALHLLTQNQSIECSPIGVVFILLHLLM